MTPESPSAAEAAPISKEHRRALYVVALTIFLDFVGFGMILPILPYFAQSLNAGPEQIALLSTAFSLAQFVMSPVLGRISDRKGRRPVMLFSIAGAVVSSLVVGLASSIWIIFLGRICAGVSKSNMSTAYAIVSDIVPPEQRAKWMGIMGACLGMGFVLGPAIGGELSLGHFPTLPFFIAAGFSAVNLLLALMWLPETHHESKRRAQVPASEESSRFAAITKHWGTPLGRLFAVCLVYFLAFSMMESIFALFNEQVWGWGAKETGRYFAFVGVVIAVVQGLIVPKLLPWMGEVRALGLGLLALAGGFAVQALSPELNLGDAATGLTTTGLAVFLLGGIWMAAGNAIVSASSSVLVSLFSSEETQGLNMGLRESVSAMGRIVGPMGAGVLFARVSPSAPIWMAAALSLLSLALVMRMGQASSEEKAPKGPSIHPEPPD